MASSTTRNQVNPYLFGAAIGLMIGIGAFVFRFSSAPPVMFPEESQQEGSTETDTPISDSELLSFIQTFDQIVEVQVKMQQQVTGEVGEPDMKVIQDQTAARIDDLVRRSSLGSERFNQLAALIQSDPELAERFNELRRSTPPARSTQ